VKGIIVPLKYNGVISRASVGYQCIRLGGLEDLYRRCKDWFLFRFHLGNNLLLNDVSTNS